ncbi:hypothetical protein TcasGA2_TC033176 [Tribolium castaneum]|uniref:Uncharacterized protein n=1 Tax=Tribolium castaneum TaxID=7070 RepID=A0A139WHF5_TRICA|nr:hypothetical protein TcasGA2_TC033176 [Tribolium castaneum]
MHTFLTLALLFHVIACLPPQIIHQTQHLTNGYSFEYEAEDGSKRREIGTFTYRENDTQPVLFVRGMYSYFVDGREFIVHYEAGQKGTRTRGDIVPKKINYAQSKNKIV